MGPNMELQCLDADDDQKEEDDDDSRLTRGGEVPSGGPDRSLTYLVYNLRPSPYRPCIDSPFLERHT